MGGCSWALFCRYNQDTDFRYPRSDTDLHDADAKDNPKADDPRLW